MLPLDRTDVARKVMQARAADRLHRLFRRGASTKLHGRCGDGLRQALLSQAISALALADETQTQRRFADDLTRRFEKLTGISPLQFEFEFGDRQAVAVSLDMYLIERSLDDRVGFHHIAGTALDIDFEERL